MRKLKNILKIQWEEIIADRMAIAAAHYKLGAAGNDADLWITPEPKANVTWQKEVKISDDIEQ